MKTKKSTLPPRTQRLLRAFAFRHGQTYPSGWEAWDHFPEPFRLFVDRNRPPRTTYELLVQLYQFGRACGRDSERLRLAADNSLGLSLDDILFGRDS